jgi:hypothetical protein
MRSSSRKQKSWIAEALPNVYSEASSRMGEGKRGNLVICLEEFKDERYYDEEDRRGHRRSRRNECCECCFEPEDQSSVVNRLEYHFLSRLAACLH